MVEWRIRHLWNQRWGRFGRRDVYVLVEDDDADHYIVQAREGGTEGHSRVWELPTRELADRLINDLTGPDADFAGDWQDLPVRPDQGRPL